MRKTSFQRVIESLSPADQRDVAGVLYEIETLGDPWHFVTPNIQLKEHFLPARAMHTVVNFLRGLAGLDKRQTEAAYSAFCRAHLGRGGSVQFDNPGLVLGCVKERDTFCRYLLRTYSLFRQYDDAQDFVNRLLGGAALSVSEDTVTLSIHQIWCTWSLDKSDPFAFAMTTHPDELRANLGLPPNAYDRLLVFRYNRNSVKKLVRPTVLDAELHPFFSPAPLTETRFGRTLPWQEAHLPELLRVGGTKLHRRPEALHPPIRVAITKQLELR